MTEKLVAMTFEEASRWIASQEARIRDLEADSSAAKQYGALIDRIEEYAAGNVTGCGTCVTIINEIRSFELETSDTHIEFLQRWMRAPNPLLGNAVPLEMMRQGRGDRVAAFIDSAYEAETPPREVGCIGPDDLVRVHSESETCDVCSAPETDADGHCTRCGLEVEDPRELAHECPPGFQAKTAGNDNR